MIWVMIRGHRFAVFERAGVLSLVLGAEGHKYPNTPIHTQRTSCPMRSKALPAGSSPYPRPITGFMFVSCLQEQE